MFACLAHFADFLFVFVFVFMIQCFDVNGRWGHGWKGCVCGGGVGGCKTMSK